MWYNDLNVIWGEYYIGNNSIIIGLTGPFGSGCTYVAKEFIEKLGYKYLSLSSVLKQEFKKSGETDINIRNNLQEFGNKMRRENGNDYFAKKVSEEIKNDAEDTKWVIDSIRNTHEIDYLRTLQGKFFLIAVWADKDTRWSRVKEKYNSNEINFNNDDKRDSDEKIEYGQQVSLCYQMADIVILNQNTYITNAEDYENFGKVINKYIKICEGELPFVPTAIETFMTMAYANSMRSSCLQRKVGALIIDDYGNVFSTGYNEVPVSEKSCKRQYGVCYRQFLRNNFDSNVDKLLEKDEKSDQIKKLYKSTFKNLDYCRALHAEENAIVNMARMGVTFPLERATLFTSTYPCNLCANKIAQVGIKKIVYFEPYPMEEAKKILSSNKVEQCPFEGVTHNGYFKFLEVLRWKFVQSVGKW